MYRQRKNRPGRRRGDDEQYRSPAYRPPVPCIEALEQRRLLSASVATIGSQNVPAGKSLLIPVSGSDTSAITYSVSSDNPSVSATVLLGDTFLQLNVASYGSMTFELFNGFAPNTVATITNLVNQGFYNGTSFWRVLNGFVAQAGGSPTGSGDYPASGTLPEFDNEPNIDAIFSGSGQLAMANAGTNTNVEQFFITDGPQRSLDYLYTLFGQLVEGGTVFGQILSAAVQSQSVGSSTENSMPLTPIIITSAQIVTDTSDAVILVLDPGQLTANITLTATDANNEQSQQTFAVTGVSDSANNDPPFITSLDTAPTTPLNTDIAIPVGAVDADGDAIQILTSQSPTGVTLSVNDNQVDVTPNSGFSGTVQFEIAPTDSTHLTDAENGQGFADLVTLTVQSQQPSTISGNVLTVNGTSGPDTIVVDLGSGTYETEVNGNIQQLSATGVTSVVVNGGDGNDVITLGPGMVAGASVQGGPGDDIITGGPGNDTLGGGQGNDTIAGTQGDDLIHGGAGNDSIGGGQGNDQIFGGLGNDTITGGQGDDTLDGGAGNNVLHGGLGNDIFFAINGLADTLYGGAGANIAHIDQGLDVIPNNDIQTILFT